MTFTLNDLERVHLTRARARVNDALEQATVLAKQIRERNGHLCIEFTHAERAVTDLEKVKRQLERID